MWCRGEPGHPNQHCWVLRESGQGQSWKPGVVIMVTRVAIMKLAHKTSGKRLSLSRAGSRVGKRLCSQSFRSLEEQGATHGQSEALSYFCPLHLNVVLCREEEGKVQSCLPLVCICATSRFVCAWVLKSVQWVNGVHIWRAIRFF